MDLTSKLKALQKREPIRIIEAVRAIVGLITALGLGFNDEVVGGVAVIIVTAAWILGDEQARKKVTPIADAILSDGHDDEAWLSGGYEDEAW